MTKGKTQGQTRAQPCATTTVKPDRQDGIPIRRAATQPAHFHRAQGSLWSCSENPEKPAEWTGHLASSTREEKHTKVTASLYHRHEHRNVTLPFITAKKPRRCKYRKTCHTQMSKTTTCWWNRAKKWGGTVLRTWKTQHTKDSHSPQMDI